MKTGNEKSQRREEKSQRRKEKRREDKKKEDQRRERGRGQKMQVRKGRKVAKHFAFPMICGSGSKSRLAKVAGGEPPGDGSCTL